MKLVLCFYDSHLGLNIMMPSYQYRDSHVKDKTVSPTVLSLTWESRYLGKTVFIMRRGPGSLRSTITHYMCIMSCQVQSPRPWLILLLIPELIYKSHHSCLHAIISYFVELYICHCYIIMNLVRCLHSERDCNCILLVAYSVSLLHQPVNLSWNWFDTAKKDFPLKLI